MNDRFSTFSTIFCKKDAVDIFRRLRYTDDMARGAILSPAA